MANDPDNIILAICKRDGTLIGVTGLHHINRIDRRAVTGTWIAPPYQDQGLGTEAKLLLLKYAFDTLNLFKVCSAAFQGNTASIKHNLNAGYRVEGVRRKHIFRNGRFIDETVLACFRETWYPKWKKYFGR